MLFLTLKAGCRVEALQLASLQRIERALAVYLVVSLAHRTAHAPGARLP